VSESEMTVVDSIRDLYAHPTFAIGDWSHRRSVAHLLEVLDVERDRVAKARDWIRNTVDPAAVGLATKQEMLDYLTPGAKVHVVDAAPDEDKWPWCDECQRSHGPYGHDRA
jgi:hypothetical protein